jgi:hypothetical protein
MHTQKALPYSIVQSLPWNNFGRKNLGYLFAMHHGARIIYDTDDDNELLMDANMPHLTFSMTDRFFRRSPIAQNLSQMPTAFNPYPVFGSPQAWPRGLPLEEIRLSSSSQLACNASAAPSLSGKDLVEEGLALDVGVIQSLANRDPDVDAIYRLSPLPLPFSFDAKVNEGLPIALAHRDRLMSPYNAQATLHFLPAFWAMLLPISVHGRVSDIWRGYFAQRLFWETGLALAFAAPWVEQIRNPHDYLADFEAESDLYTRASALLRYLSSQWTCPEEVGEVDACMMDLYLEMYRTGILEYADVQLASAWLADLKAIGYTFPTRSRLASQDNQSVFAAAIPSILEPRVHYIDVADVSVPKQAPASPGIARLMIPWQPNAHDGLPSQLACKKAWASVYVDASFERPHGVEAANITTDGHDLVVDIWIKHGSDTDDPLFVKIHCVADELRDDATSTPSDYVLITFRLLKPVTILPVFDDILLVVHFNHGQDYEHIPEFLASYGQAFPNHIFIGSENDPALDKALADRIHVVPDTRNGWGMPFAMKHAMEAHPDVKGGYLLVNNDVAMKFWKWQRRDWTRVAGSGIGCAHNITLPRDDPAWSSWHWPGEGRQSLITKFLGKFNGNDTAHLWGQCGDRILYSMASDAFYVPSRLRTRYLQLMEPVDPPSMGFLFEALTPMILSMTAPAREWASFNARYCWGAERKQCPEDFVRDPQLSVLHPWKFGLGDVPTPFARLPEQKLWYRVSPSVSKATTHNV